MPRSTLAGARGERGQCQSLEYPLLVLSRTQANGLLKDSTHLDRGIENISPSRHRNISALHPLYLQRNDAALLLLRRFLCNRGGAGAPVATALQLGLGGLLVDSSIITCVGRDVAPIMSEMTKRALCA